MRAERELYSPNSWVESYPHSYIAQMPQSLNERRPNMHLSRTRSERSVLAGSVRWVVRLLLLLDDEQLAVFVRFNPLRGAVLLENAVYALPVLINLKGFWEGYSL